MSEITEPRTVVIAGTEMGFHPGYSGEDRLIETLRRNPDYRGIAEFAYVYYVRRAGGDIKIGTSYELPTRLEAVARAHGPLRLLATHRGWFTEEKALHWHLRPHRAEPRQGEWYHPVLPLLRHVARVREQHGIVSSIRRPKGVETEPAGVLRDEIARLEREQDTEPAAWRFY